MKFLFCLYVLFVLILPMGQGSYLFSQQITDELKAKLPKPDQYKLLKAETFNDKGKTFLDKEGNLPDNFSIPEATASKEDQKKLENFYTNRIKASYCFKTANGMVYEVVEKYIRGFWEKFKGDKRPLESVLKVQNAAYDSLVIADNLRAKAEKEPYIDVTIPVVSRAEAIERQALIKLQKVLLIYMNWPEKANMAWLNSDDPTVPKNLVANTKSTIEPAKKDTLHKASDIYSLMQISKNQVDKFNEFLKEKHPDKVETYLIDFQGLYEDVIDSLHKEWHKYLYSGSVPQDTIRSTLNSLTNTQSNQPSNTKSDNIEKKPDVTASDKGLASTTVNKSVTKTPNTNVADNAQVNANKPATVAAKTQNDESDEMQKKKRIASDNLNSSKIPVTATSEKKKQAAPNRNSTSQSHNFLFKVQIAACRTKLSPSDLKSIYQGNAEIKESFEDHWFKYTIGTFTSFSEALNLRDNTNVDGVFIAAYLNGQRVRIPNYLKVVEIK